MAAQIRTAADTATTRHRQVLVGKMESAVAAYERGRYPEAARLAKQVADETPSVPAVRQLAGLAAYRAGRWREAIRQLDAYGALTDSVADVPALMDCHRALGRHRRVADLWSDLRRRSPGPEVLAEARIVAAGSLADQGDLPGGIAVLATAGAAKSLRNPAPRHLRQWYALADLYERAGDLPRARELFTRVHRADPDAYDVVERLEGLGPDRSRRTRRRPSNRRTSIAEGPRRAEGASRVERAGPESESASSGQRAARQAQSATSSGAGPEESGAGPEESGVGTEGREARWPT